MLAITLIPWMKQLCQDRMKDSSMKRLTVEYSSNGQRHRIDVDVPESNEPVDEQRREAAAFVQALVDNRQIGGAAATHEIVTDSNGSRVLRRRQTSG